ncbi:PH domain-containing protein [Pedobacter mucosus]|uniref:PH domain-containing protein n=1 Tax=Pedobacter mucosus TaxID=2895286 RepID=UPI001EE405C7|nr:PH domain-containing protein [Pedobacter mucosus]UKT62305.1 PH domain-containing protein [Pedobacter mucosus]
MTADQSPISFTNEQISIESLPKYEEITLNKPHLNYWKIILINISIWLSLLGVGLALLLIFVDEIKPNTTIILIGCITLVVLIFLLYRISFKKRGYAIRTHDVIYKSGIIAETTTIVPLNRIQHIELNEGILSRIFKLGALQIFTAGGQTGHLNITGIPIAEAKSIRDLLLKKLDLLENRPTEIHNNE